MKKRTMSVDFGEFEKKFLAGIASMKDMTYEDYVRGLDLHQARADREGVSREEAKSRNYNEAYGITKKGDDF